MNTEVLTESEPWREGATGVIKTRYRLLGYQRQGSRPWWAWRIIDLQTGHPIGPQYRSRSELLGDLDRFASVYGY